MEAKKSLGQHFLKSEKALTQILEAGDIQVSDIVLEIGPGRGALTEKILPLAKKVVAIEKDRELIPFLKEKFEKEHESGKLDIIEEDVLAFDPTALRLYKKPYKLIANIPYYITGAIIEQFLSTTYQPERMVLLIQKEVAERIVARDKKQSILSIAVSVYANPKIIAKVPAGAFVPPPKVDSAIIALTDISRNFFKDTDEHLFFQILKACFGKKRKQIGGSLGDFLKNKEKALLLLKKIGISEKARPETLSKEDWKMITKATEAL